MNQTEASEAEAACLAAMPCQLRNDNMNLFSFSNFFPYRVKVAEVLNSY